MNSETILHVFITQRIKKVIFIGSELVTFEMKARLLPTSLTSDAPKFIKYVIYNPQKDNYLYVLTEYGKKIFGDIKRCKKMTIHKSDHYYHPRIHNIVISDLLPPKFHKYLMSTGQF